MAIVDYAAMDGIGTLGDECGISADIGQSQSRSADVEMIAFEGSTFAEINFGGEGKPALVGIVFGNIGQPQACKMYGIAGSDGSKVFQRLGNGHTRGITLKGDNALRGVLGADILKSDVESCGLAGNQCARCGSNIGNKDIGGI